MNLPRYLWMLAFVWAAVSVQSPAAADEFGWADLIGASAQVYEDPYRELTYDQIEALRTLVVTGEMLSSETLTAEERSAAETKISEAEEIFAAAGIDPDWLISQRWAVADRREKAATSGNPEVDGQDITIAGFAIPAPVAEDGTAIIYLVAERGACSHMPPPNANQMIRARLPAGSGVAAIYEPVRLTGKLSISPTEQVFRVVDGMVPMNAIFMMEVARLETLEEMHTTAQQTNEWAAGIAARLRAPEQSPTLSDRETQ